MKAVFINECGPLRYASRIADGEKLIETRTRDMLKALVGERVAIVRTGRGASQVIGYVRIVSKVFVWRRFFQTLYPLHLVPAGSQFDCTGAGKWCYMLEGAEACEPYPVPADAVRHGRVWCEW